MLTEFVSANTRIAQVVWQRIPHRRTNHSVCLSGDSVIVGHTDRSCYLLTYLLTYYCGWYCMQWWKWLAVNMETLYRAS